MSHYLTPEHRLRLNQLLNELDDDQLRLILTSNTQNASSHKFQHYIRVQLLQQCLALIDNYYSPELEQTLHSLRPKRYTPDFSNTYNQQPNFSNVFNQQKQQSFYYPPPPPPSMHYNPQPNYRYPPPTPAINQQMRAIRPNPRSSSPTTILNPRPVQQQQIQPSRFSASPHSRPQIPASINISNESFRPVLQRFQVPLLPSSSNSHSTPIPPTTTPRTNSPYPISNKILHKTLPYYRPIICVHERHNIFQYDASQKKFIFHDEFLLSLDVCNQLALSYDFDPNLRTHSTRKCLLLRLVRIDQPPALHRRYDDNLPPNLSIQINEHYMTNLPAPKPSTRQQTDVLRAGRPIDITAHCMFNPILKNSINMTWFYRPENTNLSTQYLNAQYALHIFLVEHLSTDNLCEMIENKPMRFIREDFIRLLTNAQANDRDHGLEVSDQRLKLICPIDYRRMKIPVRATTCQHLQCFDLINYTSLNEKSNKWMCPICNKPALFEDLQIDAYTESILNSINNDNVTEITINRDLHWSPVLPLEMNQQATDLNSTTKLLSRSSSVDVILLDDDD